MATDTNINALSAITTLNDDDALITNKTTGNVTNRITKQNLLADVISSDADNGLVQSGTDNKLYVLDPTEAPINADNITSGTLDADRQEVSGVTAGSYTNADITVDNKGRVTAAANGASEIPKTVYSVNSAYTVSGYADFINKVSDTAISFDVDDGTTYTPLVMSFPDGTQETLTSLANITSGIVDNATNFVVYEKSAGAASLVDGSTNTIKEQITEPSTPVNGDYWLDISVKPYVPKKRVGGAWVDTQFIKLGQVIKTAGTLGTPVSYALNGFYKSDLISIVANTNYTRNHNIGSLPKFDVQFIVNSSGKVITENLEYFFSTSWYGINPDNVGTFGDELQKGVRTGLLLTGQPYDSMLIIARRKF